MEKIKTKSRLLINHSKDCYAIKNVKNKSWMTAWSGVIKYSYFGNINGAKTKHGGTYWHVISCNCTTCPAEKAVNSDILNNA